MEETFNAWAGHAGLRQRRYVGLGLPLLAVLPPEQRVALLAHELAHFRNGDPLRSRLVSTAIVTLDGWYLGLRPPSIWPGQQQGDSEMGGFIAFVSTLLSNVTMYLLSWIPRSLTTVAVHLAWDTSQRAEYLADRLGAEVSGGEPFARMLASLLLDDLVPLAAQRAELRADSPGAIEELGAQISEMPLREGQRRHRAAALEETCLDATHPPLAYRIALLRVRPAAGRVRLSADESAAIDAELRDAYAWADGRLRDGYRRRLYF